MILDPNRNGIEVWYDNKLRVLEGGIEECIEWIIEISLMETDEYDEDEVKEILKHKRGNIVFFKDRKYLQFNSAKVYLDCTAIGQLWKMHFDKAGFVVHKLDIKRIKL